MLKSGGISLLSLVLALFLVGSVWAACPDGDLTGDCEVDFEDMWAMAAQWLHPAGSEADLDYLNGVEGRDFAMLAGKWNQEGIPLVINELMASNGDTIEDPQHENDDWIEIYNAGDHAINIAGMHLTDNLGNPAKWRIPSNVPSLTTIAAGRYLLIWADGDVEDNGTVQSGLHANFELDAQSDQVGFYDSNWAILIDSVAFKDQTADISYGRLPNGSDTWRFFGVPSPGKSNVSVYTDLIEDLEVSHKRGFYEDPFSVTIACETDGVKIYYTLDGSDPYNTTTGVATGTRYSSAVPISKTT